jgi:hypothetical protein
MTKTLPKGHVSCLSSAFRYTPAAHTNVASTFARIARELRTPISASRRWFEPLTPIGHRPFPRETIESARRLLREGGVRPATHLAR